jgi:D-xylose transport system substrate-binding protein
MRKLSIGVLAPTAAAALALAGCGSSGGGSNAEPGTSESPAISGKVGVILPDTKSSARWENNDRPSLQAAFDAAGVESDIQNAQGDVPTFGSICEAMITEGVKVLMIVNLDSDSGAACLSKATAAGIATIDYDRLTLGGGASYYVSFDNVQVGALQGEGLIACLDAKNVTKANIVYINGAATDNNATLFKQGYEEALADKIDSGDYTLVGDQTGEWDPEKAQSVMEGFLTQQKGDIQGAIVANDGMAGGASAALSKQGLEKKIPITGQDATDDGLNRVLTGLQCGTVFKDTDLEADAAAKIAIALATGDTASADAIATGTVTDTNLNVEVPFAPATPVWISDADGVKTVIATGYTTAANVCTGAAESVCKKDGIS